MGPTGPSANSGAVRLLRGPYFFFFLAAFFFAMECVTSFRPARQAVGSQDGIYEVAERTVKEKIHQAGV